jgi:glycine/D-amino acid oxidase-like deaminating enzyme
MTPPEADSGHGRNVLVVGAGPVGLTAACELARHGARVRLIDLLDEPNRESRAVVVHPRPDPLCRVRRCRSTSTGAVDPLAGLADACAAEALWLHVDAAYGGFAALTPKGPGAAGRN